MTSLDLWPIGNCQVSGLIDAEGALVWGCVPRVDGDPVFCALLNGERREAGVWRIELEGQASADPRYDRNSAVLTTRLTAKDGSAVDIIDFCPRFERSGRMYRPVAFVRIVRPVAGSPRMKMVLAPMRDYGTEAAP
ncbi:MAG: trehalase-like domain-containing protein, partial [Pseudomonadota bacterium]